MARRFGYGRTIVVGSAGYLPLLVIPLTDHSSTLTFAGWAAALVVAGLTGGMVNVLVVTVRTQLTPSHLLGRVGASVRLIMYGGLPVGALTGGALAHTLGHRSALWLGVIGVVVSAVSLLPLRNSSDPSE
ncbi:MFS transporter [Kibdelosporangium persicum]